MNNIVEYSVLKASKSINQPALKFMLADISHEIMQNFPYVQSSKQVIVKTIDELTKLHYLHKLKDSRFAITPDGHAMLKSFENSFNQVQRSF